MRIADSELLLTVYNEVVVLAGLAYLVVFPDRVDEECFHHLLLVYLDRIDGVHQVGVVHHHLGWFLWEPLPGRVNHVDKSRISKILDVVHYRSSAGVDLFGKLAHVGSLGTFYSELIEEPLDLGEIFQFDLLDEEDVNLGRHVHCL